MRYDYSIVVTDTGSDIDIFTGECEGSTPRDAVENALNERTDWLDDEFANLAPTIEITRDTRFEAWRAEADSHGLGIASVILLPLHALPENWKIDQ